MAFVQFVTSGFAVVVPLPENVQLPAAFG